MPTIATRNIIQDARDQLVGKVPLPIDQCNEITRALIYKFLSAADTESIEDGGEPTYFVDAHRESHWDRLMAPEQTANEIQRLYTAGLTMLGSREDIPPAFQTIYQDAFMPYNDPIVLRDFLGIINRFNTDDTESIGDAYETMLQYLGAQASAGQFRTPRHIIDFIVGIVNPQKHETILDPACGTAGFLASAWQHINRASDLTAADRSRLAGSIVGYDISPDMARLASINLYLSHGQDPDVSVYDTLTHEDRWNDHYDVILANPPFMSPKGGIRPHQRFFTNSKRSEVLFVDYIMGHLNERGRAGVIVPEGVIFQSGNAYKQLRRLLVDTCLVAVISLPGGVFQPYSGVKTSILIMDREVAKLASNIAFFKVQNDGRDLGAQRRPIAANDLPAVQAELGEYLRRLRGGEPIDDFAPEHGLIGPKERIAENGDYNLSGERYRENGNPLLNWPTVRIGDVCTVNPRKTELTNIDPTTQVSFVPMADLSENGMDFYACGEKRLDEIGQSYTYFADNDVLLARVTPCFENGKAGIARNLSNGIGFGSSEFIVLRCGNRLLPEIMYHFVKLPQFRVPAIRNMTGTGGLQRIPRAFVENFQIPLPPLEVQREIVAEIEGYQRVIDGARAVVDNWRPRIAVDPEWPLVRLGDACKINPETVNPAVVFPNQNIHYADITSVENGTGRFLGYTAIPSEEAPSRARRVIREGDVLLSTVRPNLKAFTLLRQVKESALASTGFAVLRARTDAAVPEYVLASVSSDEAVGQMIRMMGKGAYPSINQHDVSIISIPLPPLETQQAIVSEIAAEQAAVDHARDLVARMQGRIDAAIGRVWGG